MSKKSFAVSLIILFIAIGSVKGISLRGEPIVVSKNLVNLPMVIAGYKASEDYFSESIVNELNADVYVYRHYRKPDGKQIDLYIGYYGTSKGGRTGHNPYACLPGAGWGIIETQKVKLNSHSYPRGVSMNYILAKNGDRYESVLHWYQSAGTKILDTGIKQNIQRFIGRVFYNRNDGAFVRISRISAKQGIDESKSLLKNFAQETLNLLPDYWPLEMER